MQQQTRTGSAEKRSAWWSQILRNRAAVTGISVVCLLSLLGAGLWANQHQLFSGNKTIPTNGSARWTNDTTTTTPTFSISAPDTQPPEVAAQFKSYYSAHHGADTLGVPVTAAFPIRQGWIQFFVSGALLLPDMQALSLQNHPSDDVDELINNGLTDKQTGVILLPLLQSLLTVGSQVPIGGSGSPLTYVNLRAETQPALMKPDPNAGQKTTTVQQEANVQQSTSAQPDASGGSVFVQGGTRNGQPVGHLVPLSFWQYINRSSVSPDGWQTDIGAPLTEAISFKMMVQGQLHTMLVQIFWREALLLDSSVQDVSGQSQVQRLDTGLAYLRTLGPPQIVLGGHSTLWATGDMTLLNAPGNGDPAAHVGQQFPLKLLGNAAWNNGTLWYHVSWSAPKSTGTGWAPASGTTFVSPGAVPGWASVDVLSSSLAAYLAGGGDNIGVTIYDLTRHRYYTYNANTQFLMGSSIKVPIMLTLLNTTEGQGSEPDGDQMNLLTTMIENSDNDAAGTLYYDELGVPAITDYLKSIDVSGMDPDCCAFGYSLTTPVAMVKLLTLLHDGKILTAQDRDLALSLMSQIESDQRVGVGDSAPDGASWAMKDGWLPGPDDLWAMNSSGIISKGDETYIISVYTQEQDSLGNAQDIVQRVCNVVASLLL